MPRTTIDFFKRTGTIHDLDGILSQYGIKFGTDYCYLYPDGAIRVVCLTPLASGINWNLPLVQWHCSGF